MVFPIRFLFVFLGFFCFFMLYSLRVNLSVAIVSMVKTNHADIGKSIKLSECISNATADSSHTSQTSNPNRNGVFKWSDRGVILGSFFWGYVVTQIPGGVLAKRFGSKIVLACCIFFTSIFTLISPVAAKLHYILFVICRVIEGLFEGLAYPAMHSMIGCWIPKNELGFLSTIIYSGAPIGTVVTMPVSGLLCNSSFLGGWPSAFYVPGTVGVIWSCLWMLLITDSPRDHRWISDNEIYLITKEQDIQQNVKTPWKAILTSLPVWALIFAQFGYAWGFYTLLTQLPTYFQSVLGFEIRKNGLLSAIPYLLQAIVGYIVSFIFDLSIKRNFLQVNSVRKLCTTIAFLGPASCLIGVTLAKCNSTLSVIMFSLAMAINGFLFCGLMVTHVDMTPNFAGPLMGLANCIASFTGFLAPFVAGLLTEGSNSLENWSFIFYIAVIIYVFTASFFVIFGSAKLQNFDAAKSDNIQIHSF